MAVLWAIARSGDADAQVATAFPTKMNVLYIGVENPVRISLDGRLCKDFHLSLPGAEVTPLGDCLFHVRFDALTVPQVRFAYITDKDGGIVDSVRFLVRALPDPLTDRQNKSFIRPMPTSATSMYAILDTLQFEWPFTVLDFEVTRQRGKQVTKTIVNKTAAFSADVLELLRTAISRDSFYFESIRVKGPDGYLRYLNSVRLMCE